MWNRRSLSRVWPTFFPFFNFLWGRIVYVKISLSRSVTITCRSTESTNNNSWSKTSFSLFRGGVCSEVTHDFSGGGQRSLSFTTLELPSLSWWINQCWTLLYLPFYSVYLWKSWGQIFVIVKMTPTRGRRVAHMGDVYLFPLHLWRGREGRKEGEGEVGGRGVCEEGKGN